MPACISGCLPVLPAACLHFRLPACLLSKWLSASCLLFYGCLSGFLAALAAVCY
jgi:hypothetical protein